MTTETLIWLIPLPPAAGVLSDRAVHQPEQGAQPYRWRWGGLAFVAGEHGRFFPCAGVPSIWVNIRLNRPVQLAADR